MLPCKLYVDETMSILLIPEPPQHLQGGPPVILFFSFTNASETKKERLYILLPLGEENVSFFQSFLLFKRLFLKKWYFNLLYKDTFPLNTLF